MAQKSAKGNGSFLRTERNNLLFSTGITRCESSRERPSCGLLAYEYLSTTSGRSSWSRQHLSQALPISKKTPCLALLLTDLAHRAHVLGQSPTALWCPVGYQKGTLPAGLSVASFRAQQCQTRQIQTHLLCLSKQLQPGKLLDLPFVFIKGAVLRTWGLGLCQEGVLWEGGRRMQEGV